MTSTSTTRPAPASSLPWATTITRTKAPASRRTATTSPTSAPRASAAALVRREVRRHPPVVLDSQAGRPTSTPSGPGFSGASPPRAPPTPPPGTSSSSTSRRSPPGSTSPTTAFRPAAGWDYARWGADVVVAGHQHIYDLVVVDGPHYVTAEIGTNGLSRGGFPLVSSPAARSHRGPGRPAHGRDPTSLTLEYRTPGGHRSGRRRGHRDALAPAELTPFGVRAVVDRPRRGPAESR